LNSLSFLTALRFQSHQLINVDVKIPVDAVLFNGVYIFEDEFSVEHDFDGLMLNEV
jgi:hypothetical protein